MSDKNKPLCPNARAIPPSPVMLKHGNDYYTCSSCGERCEVEKFSSSDQPLDKQTDGGDDELIEQLAAIEHRRWAQWQAYVQHNRCTVNSNGDYIIPAAYAERWAKQIATPYADLSEAEKESDRAQVMRYWQLIQAREQEAERRGRKQGSENIMKVFLTMLQQNDLLSGLGEELLQLYQQEGKKS